MIIVAGHLRVDPAYRDQYLDSSVEVVTRARAATGCLDFSLAADLLELDRINIYERWESRALLDAFRGSGPDEDQSASILAAEVSEFYYDREEKL